MIEFRRARWLLVAAGIAAGAAVAIGSASGAEPDPIAGSQGTDVALPATDSVVTVGGRGAFSELEITINQTRNLTNQAVSITWTGGDPSRPGPGLFAANFLQIFQCWGEDDGSNPLNPGPPPEQCVQGAVNGAPGGGVNSSLVPPGSNALNRVISQRGWAPLDPPVGFADPSNGYVWRQFRSVSGRVVDAQFNDNYNPFFPDTYWLNDLFDIVTTNEIGVAATAPDGTGSVLMEVTTGRESSGLGCGQPRQPLPNGERKVPQCWIVIVPRGEPIDENVNTSPNNEGEFAAQRGVLTSPVSPQAWPNRIAVPIDFNPVDTPCSLDVQSRRIVGSEFTLPAVVSWQPALCGGGELPPFDYTRAPDDSARRQLTRGDASMVVVNRPLTQPADPTGQIVYAPLTNSGIVIGFNIERTPSSDPQKAPPDAQALQGVPVAELNLTPRLVAKLLTQSYRYQVDIQFQPAGYEWEEPNPRHLYEDPDFIQFNPEFAQLQMTQGRQLSGLHTPTGNSDAAQQLWRWILADPEATAWLDGAPDEWGMVVNPAYEFVNEAVPSSFPKADEHCYQPPDVTIVNPPYTPPQLCSIAWMPPASSFADAASNTRRAYDRARIGEDLANPPQTAELYWRRSNPQQIGQRGFLAVTDSASATQYGIQAARLSRAGDNSPDRVFIPAESSNLLAAVNAMRPGTEPQVVETTNELPADAYPLTVVNYAAIQPLTLDEAERDDFAGFLRYAVGAGQQSGDQPGQLPAGYAPLTRVQREQAFDAAYAVSNLEPPPTTTTTTTSTTTVAPTTTAVTTTIQPTTPTVAAVPAVNNASNSASSNSASSNTTVPRAQSTSTPTTPLSATTTSTTLPAVVVTEPVPVASTVPESVPPTTAPQPAPAPETTAVSQGLTPETPVGATRYAAAGTAGLGLLAALVALEVTKAPRRRIGAAAVAGEPSPDDATEAGT